MIDLCCGIGGIRRGLELAGELKMSCQGKRQYAVGLLALFGDNGKMM
jgi:Site-specific DNA methylase